MSVDEVSGTYKIIAKHGEHYRADPAVLTVDLWQFQTALTDAQRAAGDPAAETAALQCAADIYRGDLADGTDYLWIEPASEDLHRRALDCLVRLAELHHGNDVARVISTLERAVALDPYAEELYRRLITLHLEATDPTLRGAATDGFVTGLRTLEENPIRRPRLSSETPPAGHPYVRPSGLPL